MWSPIFTVIETGNRKGIQWDELLVMSLYMLEPPEIIVDMCPCQKKGWGLFSPQQQWLTLKAFQCSFPSWRHLHSLIDPVFFFWGGGEALWQPPCVDNHQHYSLTFWKTLLYTSNSLRLPRSHATDESESFSMPHQQWWWRRTTVCPLLHYLSLLGIKKELYHENVRNRKLPSLFLPSVLCNNFNIPGMPWLLMEDQGPGQQGIIKLHWERQLIHLFCFNFMPSISMTLSY